MPSSNSHAFLPLCTKSSTSSCRFLLSFSPLFPFIHILLNHIISQDDNDDLFFGWLFLPLMRHLISIAATFLILRDFLAWCFLLTLVLVPIIVNSRNTSNNTTLLVSHGTTPVGPASPPYKMKELVIIVSEREREDMMSTFPNS